MKVISEKSILNFFSPTIRASLKNRVSFRNQYKYPYECRSQDDTYESLFLGGDIPIILEAGCKVFVISYGRNYKNICKALDGQYIDFNREKPISLNPFYKIPEGTTEDELLDRESSFNIIRLILQDIFLMKKELVPGLIEVDRVQDAYNEYDYKNKLSDFDVVLQKCIQAAWQEKKSKTQINDVINHLKKADSREADELSKSLSLFITSESYKHLLSSSEYITFSSNLVVFDMHKLYYKKNLMLAAIQTLLLQINQVMAMGDKEQSFVIIIDDAGELCGGKSVFEFVYAMDLITRKNSGRLILGENYEHAPYYGVKNTSEFSHKKIVISYDGGLFPLRRLARV